MSNSTPLPEAPTDAARLHLCQFILEGMTAWSEWEIIPTLKDQSDAVKEAMLDLYNRHLRAISVIMYEDTGDVRFLASIGGRPSND